ncbi:MAG: hypothetical protein MUO76_04720 [Anaerolineaceae bacterium]|nr:hypothetical protein [Anaerolineaceae bacterium]
MRFVENFFNILLNIEYSSGGLTPYENIKVLLLKNLVILCYCAPGMGQEEYNHGAI